MSAALDLFGPRPRRSPRVLMKVIDAGQSCYTVFPKYWLRMRCPKCRHETEVEGTKTESGNQPCPKCNP